MAGSARYSDLTIGILALQGCVKPHKTHLKAAGALVVEVRQASQLEGLDGIILPGGESTTLLKLIRLFDLKKSLDEAALKIPVWGICAGAILMAKKVRGPEQESFSFLNMEVERNAYGRQLQSFETEIAGSQVAFIRAPLFVSVASSVSTLAQSGSNPVWVEEGRHMATSFHPELGTEYPSKIHTYFLEKCLKQKS